MVQILESKSTTASTDNTHRSLKQAQQNIEVYNNMVFRMSFAVFSIDFVAHLYFGEAYHAVVAEYLAFIRSLLWLRDC